MGRSASVGAARRDRDIRGVWAVEAASGGAAERGRLGSPLPSARLITQAVVQHREVVRGEKAAATGHAVARGVERNGDGR